MIFPENFPLVNLYNTNDIEEQLHYSAAQSTFDLETQVIEMWTATTVNLNFGKFNTREFWLELAKKLWIWQQHYKFIHIGVSNLTS